MGKLNGTDSHHTIGFDSIEKLDWHLANLWNEGYKTIIDIDSQLHENWEARKAHELKWWRRYTKKLKGKHASIAAKDLRQERKNKLCKN